MKNLNLLLLVLFSSFSLNAQTLTGKVTDSATNESIAIAEVGGAISWNISGGGLAFGPDFAIEATPIENWLELEAGASPVFSYHSKELDCDLLFKKPWDLSTKVEFMFGIGAAWIHNNNKDIITNSVGGEIALDFMFWPFARHQFGWYLEPGYEYNFGQGNEQSVGISGGLLIAIP